MDDSKILIGFAILQNAEVKVPRSCLRLKHVRRNPNKVYLSELLIQLNVYVHGDNFSIVKSTD